MTAKEATRERGPNASKEKTGVNLESSDSHLSTPSIIALTLLHHGGDGVAQASPSHRELSW
jgi:hypothetical protein